MARPIQCPTGTGDVQLETGSGNVRGWSVHESGAVAAVASFILRDGTSTSGAILATVELAADTSHTIYFAGDGIDFQTGLFLDRVSGETEGAVFVD